MFPLALTHLHATIRQALEQARDRDHFTGSPKWDPPGSRLAGTRGIDVSHHQGPIDWQTVAESGERFAYVKATEGRDYVDPRFSENFHRADGWGMRVGAYHFARLDSGSPHDPERDAIEEMLDFRRAVPSFRYREHRHRQLPPVIDVELGGIKGRPRAWCLRWLRQAIATAQHEFGRQVMVYTGYWTWRYLGSPEEFNGIPLWLADYTNRVRPRRQLGTWRPTVWQYTGRGTVPGIAGRCDRNRWLADVD